MRQSGQEFIYHPWGAAKILAGLQLDEATLAAALLHDVVEDTGTEIDEIRAEFGDEIAKLVEGVTKLTRVQFQSREHAEAENYRKLIVAMAEDVRVILIKLADRLHNLRTIEYLGKQKQVQKARETLEVYAPLAHRLGIHALKWELEDLAFQTLHPRKYEEIKQMVAERRADREEHVREAAIVLQKELDKVDIPAEISGRAKHFYSIYDKMAKKGREFNEIYDLTAMRVIVGAGWGRGNARLLRRTRADPLALEADARAVQGLHRDAEVQRLPRAAHDGDRAAGPAARDPGADARDARDRRVRRRCALALQARRQAEGRRVGRVGQAADGRGHRDEADPREFMKTFRTDLFDEEVHVFTPKGQVKTLPAGATPIDFAYAVHTDVGHRTVGAKINGRIVPLHYQLKNGDFVEILTSKQGRGPSRDWLSLAKSTRARNKIRQWFSRETREEAEQKGRDALEHALKAQNLPYAKLRGSATLAQVIRGRRLQEGRGLLRRARLGEAAAGLDRQQGDPAPEDGAGRRRGAGDPEGAEVAHGARGGNGRRRARRRGRARPPREVLHSGAGRRDRRLHLARQGHHDPSRGLSERAALCVGTRSGSRRSRGTGRLPRRASASRSPSTPGIAPRLLEDVARTFAEHGANIVSYGGVVEDQLAKNWYTVEVGDVKSLRTLLNSLRNLDAVFDAYRVTPS